MTRLASLLAASLALALSIIAPGRASACSCMERSFAELAAEADAIFEGRVAAIEPIDELHVRVRLDVVQTWREANSEHVEVRTAAHSAACGVSFEVGRSYLVLAEQSEGALTVSLCGGTRPMEEANDARAALGSGVIPVDIADEEVADESRSSGPSVAPRRGGCAGCAVASGGEMPAFLATIGLAMAIAARRRRIR